MELWIYFQSLWSYWWALMSCAAFTLLGVIVMLFNKSNRWALWATFGAAVAMLFLASFLAWRDQYRGRIIAETKIEQLTSTKFGGSITQVYAAPAGPNGENCIITLLAKIINTGAPSIADGMNVSVTRKGELMQIVTLSPPLKGITLFEGDTKSPGVFIPESEYLPRKAVLQPIPTGGGVFGFIQIVVNKVRKDEVASKDTTIRIEFYDVRGRQFHIQTQGLPEQTHIPDMRKLLRENENGYSDEAERFSGMSPNGIPG